MICHEKSTIHEVSTKPDITCYLLHEFIRKDARQPADIAHSGR
ncbi:MAG: hypothetical protein ACTS73_05825 [Arsenophonus sp. NEOnobi-MAG3]